MAQKKAKPTRVNLMIRSVPVEIVEDMRTLARNKGRLLSGVLTDMHEAATEKGCFGTAPTSK
jgi:hypothetical protein